MSRATIDFTAPRELVGDLVVLRPVTAEDADPLHPLLADHEVGVLTGSVNSSAATDEAPPWSVEELRDIYGRWADAEDRLVWVIVDRATGDVVGESVLNDLDQANQSCGFRIWISGATGRGLGTEAVQLTVDEGFRRGLHRIELEVYDHNPRARRVYEKVGFVYEGTKRGALRMDDRWIDCHLMAIVDQTGG